jgi:hypothetical protein
MIEYQHIDSSLATVGDLLSSDNMTSIINTGAITKIELYAFENNIVNIYDNYSNDDQKSFELDYVADKAIINNYESQKEAFSRLSDEERESQLSSLSSQLKINQIDIGTKLSIPEYAIKQENIIVQSNQNVKQESFKEFYVNELRILELDENYRHIDEELDGNLGTVKKLLPNQTVWLWSKALSESDDIEGKIINLSPFIENLSTSVTETGGNWSITLPPIVAKYEDGWQMMGLEESSQLIARGSFQDKKKGENYYFYNIIQPNDIIFIRFETLRNEVKERLRYKDFIVPFSALSSGIYDMIALVDSVNIIVNPVSNDVSIQIQGRDLVKLLIDDGTYFFATEYIEGGAFVQNSDNKKALQRVEGKLHQLSLAAIKSIDFSLKFIINALSNINVCQDSVFSSYKKAQEIQSYDSLQNKFVTKEADITSKRSEVVFINEDKTQYKIEENNCSGIWQIIKLVIDKNVENYRQVDATLGNEMGSILNSINKVCQKPFAEFFTDTYRNQFFFIVRRPPFDFEGYKALADVAITIKSSDVLSYNLNFSDQETYSWFRLQPQAASDEFSVKTVWAYLKAIKFEEYAFIFGDKCLSQVSNYLHYQPVVGENEILNVNSVTRQFTKDFKYMIESNQYAPFVRKGQIVMNGDRRIKRGTVIYFEKTSEFCYVDSVTQSFNISESSIDRTTTIQVSRCMVSDYLDQYFKIIDLSLDDRLFNNSDVKYLEFIENSMTKWKVNSTIFNWFLMRKQFADQLNPKSITGSNASTSSTSESTIDKTGGVVSVTTTLV